MPGKHSHKYDMSAEEAPLGYCLLGRDTKTWGSEGTGTQAIDPDGECDDGYCPHYNDVKYDPLSDKIHLNIASFRDRLCPRTLHNLFKKAVNPKRIYVRIIQQVEHESDKVDDADCWDMFCKTYGNCEQYKDQVQVWTMDAKTAKGPTDPRSKLTALIEYDYKHGHDPLLQHVQPQDYCMQTDSHMDFSVGFDVGLIEMFHRTENDYAVLSTYVAPMEQTDTFPTEVPHLCMVEFTVTWRNWGTKFCESLKRPKLTNLPWGAGLSFSKCHADLNVPYDPYLPNMFDGEEVSRGFRYFTHGYDVYTPDQVLVTHDYFGHQSNPNVHTWGGYSKKGELSKGDSDMSVFMKDIDDNMDSIKPKGIKRINILLGFILQDQPEMFDAISASRHGHGDRRTLEQAIEFSGFDPAQRKMVKNKCGNLKWVPYDEVDSNFGLEDSLNRPIWIKAAASDGEYPHHKPQIITVESRQAKLTRKLGQEKHQQEVHELIQAKLNSDGWIHSLLVVLGIIILILAIVFKRQIYRACKPKKSERMV